MRKTYNIMFTFVWWYLFQDITGHDLTGIQALVLDAITYIGCSFSIVALVITLTIFIGFRLVEPSQQNENNIIKIVAYPPRTHILVFLE